MLKVLNFLYTNQNLISDKGIRFIMKANHMVEPDNTSMDISKNIDSSPLTNQNEPGFSDIDLTSGFAEIQCSDFHHHKLDSYLQRSIKDPYNLVQGAISPTMQ